MRLDYRTSLPAGLKGMLALEQAVHDSSLEPRLLELVKMRASQINGCAHCLDMHSKDARALGEDEQRLHLLAAWREAPVYSDRERAALAWCETLTRVAETGAPDADFAPLQIDVVHIDTLGWNAVQRLLANPKALDQVRVAR